MKAGRVEQSKSGHSFGQSKTKSVKRAMLKKLLLTIAALVGLVIGATIYASTQRPKVWCDRQWAGIALYNGGYRSWTLSFCDGFAHLDGKWQPVVVETNGYRKGYFHWPKYGHVDVRKFGITQSR